MFDEEKFTQEFNEKILGKKPPEKPKVEERPCFSRGYGKKKKVKMRRLKSEDIK